MEILKLSVLVLLLLSILVSPVKAQSIPVFQQCINPHGTLKVKYDFGTHGIPGDPGVYSGSDAVYQTTSNTLIQCYCAQDGSGIQTNWWRASSLAQEEIDNLENQGWVYIPDGSLWGLDQAPYVAKNSNFTCKENGVGGTDVQSGSLTSPTLIFADTGGIGFPLFFTLTGILSLISGIKLLKKTD
jgi:hypothetical protein